VDSAHLLQVQHRLNVNPDGVHRAFQIFLRVARAQTGGFLDAQSGGNVAVQRVVGAGLVGEQVRDDLPFYQFRQNLCAISYKPDGERTDIFLGLSQPGESFG